jgi:hypothetical protein
MRLVAARLGTATEKIKMGTFLISLSHDKEMRNVPILEVTCDS